MQLKSICSCCNGTGLDVRNSDPPVQYTCRICDGVGYFLKDIIGNEFTQILEKCEEIKTKQNQMQADINYIKTKVG